MQSEPSVIRILFIGDIIGRPGRNALKTWLQPWVEAHAIDLVVGNGENAAGGMGLTTRVFDELLAMGIDVITSGNHIWSKKEIYPTLNRSDQVLRPANYPDSVPGKGYAIHTVKGHKILILNLEGRVFMKSLECPFRTADKILDNFHGKIILVDFHAEATSEKIALGWHLDGRVSAVMGTHTHVQTADERILPQGTAYITDAGMTGPIDSVIGMKKDIALSRFLTQLPAKFDVARGKCVISGAAMTIRCDTGRATAVERIQVFE
ncbi:MAG: TIGR00282 family metallophosphoesterase [Nitrospiraceae bacterium]|nr:TIGR00282 family metallophosphoesterase [Nitrospiraceae bacterium]